MDLFYKAAALILITVVLSLFLGRWNPDYVVLLSIAACCIAAVSLAVFLEPVFSLVRSLQELAGFQDGMLGLLMKAAGITFVAEIAAMLCTDAGNGSLAKLVQLLGSGAVLYTAVPLFQTVLNLLTDILGEL